MQGLGLHITSRYAGGNIRIVEEDDTTVKVTQDLRDCAGWWFYWSFRADSDRERTVRFAFQNGEVIGPRGPAFSRDGINWTWLGAAESASDRQSFTYSFAASECVYFSFCMPYQMHHFEQFYSRISSHPQVRRSVLAITEQLRPVPLLVIGNPAADRDIVFTGRHHACESVSAYVLEGILRYCLEAPNPKLLQQYRIHYIPFVDLDGVENGDQGKNRMPHDHNRDYTEAPMYRSTAAVMAYVKTLHLTVGIDFHCPYKWGERNDAPFIVKRGPPAKEENERFGRLLARETKHGEVAYDPANDIEMGEDWNQPGSATCSAFFERSGAKLAFSFEYPYFGRGETVITQSNSREFGTGFARALEAYLFET